MSDHTTRPFQPELPFDEIPYGYCQCGCGQKTHIETHTHPERGQFAGEPRRFLRGHQGRKPTPKADELKICSRCKQGKPLSDYSQRRSGKRAGQYYSHCRACAVEATMASRSKDASYQVRQRELQRKFRERHQERLTIKSSERYAKNPEARKAGARKTREKNPLREKAHIAVRRAIARGDLPPATAMVCERCQEAQAAHWHHDMGYAEEYRLHVIALCKSCHGKAHWLDIGESNRTS